MDQVDVVLVSDDALRGQGVTFALWNVGQHRWVLRSRERELVVDQSPEVVLSVAAFFSSNRLS